MLGSEPSVANFAHFYFRCSAQCEQSGVFEFNQIFSEAYIKVAMNGLGYDMINNIKLDFKLTENIYKFLCLANY